MSYTLDASIVDYVRQAAASDRYAAYLRNTLLDLIAINTAANGPIAEVASREGQLFDWIGREIADLAGPEAVVERVPIDPGIADDPDYTPPGYARGQDGVIPPVDEAYRDRMNLVAIVPAGSAPAGSGVILHAHVDVVPPWFAPRSEGWRVVGRGASDNKAQVAILLAQIKLIHEMREQLGQGPTRPQVYQFVIDEEIGGNGSLSLAREPRFAGADVLMFESTGLTPYCAHRGAVYYRCRLTAGANERLNPLELFPFVVLALEEEGRRIQAETQGPLFTAAHVQTNHGSLGCFGAAPGCVCDHVAVEITAKAKANPERIGMKIIEILDDALAAYVRQYGDKSREEDAATGRPKVARHFELKVTPGPERHSFRLDVHGKGGHMASVGECDNAITKAAYLLAALLRVGSNFPGVGARGRLVGDEGDGREIVLQGGQGFTPSHRMADVQSRMTAAARRGAREYCRARGAAYDDGMVEMLFDQLHNDAYADSPESRPMQALRAAFEATGQPWPELTAWETSCDARIYHHKGYPVAIFGAGRLDAAHSPDEYVDVADLQKGLAIATLATWAMIG